MNVRAIFSLFFLLMIFGSFPISNTLAGQNISYKAKLSAYTLGKIKQHIPSLVESGSPQIAAADLNEDGIDEYIVRHTECDKSIVCTHEVLAETDEKLISIGRFEGIKVALGQKYTNGVRNILLFSNTRNDFDYTLYVWSAEKSRYMKDDNG